MHTVSLFPRSTVPVTSVPMKLPWMVFPLSRIQNHTTEVVARNHIPIDCLPRRRSCCRLWNSKYITVMVP